MVTGNYAIKHILRFGYLLQRAGMKVWASFNSGLVVDQERIRFSE